MKPGRHADSQKGRESTEKVNMWIHVKKHSSLLIFENE
jgi:hypothetical protein